MATRRSLRVFGASAAVALILGGAGACSDDEGGEEPIGGELEGELEGGGEGELEGGGEGGEGGEELEEE